MCTAINYNAKCHYFGRNLDLERTYSESVTVTPRLFPFDFRCGDHLFSHYAMIGMASVFGNYPLYYEATNEHGLSMAGLNFVGNAVYSKMSEGKLNLTQFELIPMILGTCKNLSEAIGKLKNINLVPIPYSEELPLPELHWIVSDRYSSIVLEYTADGQHIYDNPTGVLTNNPPFCYHIENLNNYVNITAKEAQNRFSEKLPLDIYSRGMGAIGLPGDMSSSSRFIRAVFAKFNSKVSKSEEESVGQFFHILSFVEQVEGCVRIGAECERTQYSSCCNTDTGDYYYKTYDNSQISVVSMNKLQLQSNKLFCYPIRQTQNIYRHN